MNSPPVNPLKRAASSYSEPPTCSGRGYYYGLDQNCNQVRTKIRTFLDNSDMKVADFYNAIGVSANAYFTFMRQSGPKAGAHSVVMGNAWAFFKERERAGEKMPRAKKAKKADDKNVNDVEALKGVKIPGEEAGNAAVYDTCDEVRRKIKKHLDDTSMTQAQFLRDFQALMPDDFPQMTARQFGTFRNKKGSLAGNTSPVFYAGYIFFEKLRIEEGKKKTKGRETMEETWGGKGGIDREHESGGRLWLMKGEHAHVDRQGVTHIEGLGRHFKTSGK